MITNTISVPEGAPITVHAVPLTREAFAPFGSVVSNPAPASLPSNTPATSVAALPCGATSANQGSAIQYRELCTPRDLYAQAPSGRPAGPRLTMFVCGARELVRSRGRDVDGREADGPDEDGLFFEVNILERHPFTTQTFAPLGVDPAADRRYLVIVAPSLAPSPDDAALPAPSASGDLPGRGLPDLKGLRAFVATGNQAVTYGAGTWHAPMAALGPAGSAIDFVVTQSANGVPVEDCQEVVLQRRETSGDVGGSGGAESSSGGGSGIYVRIPDATSLVTRSPSKSLTKL